MMAQLQSASATATPASPAEAVPVQAEPAPAPHPALQQILDVAATILRLVQVQAEAAIAATLAPPQAGAPAPASGQMLSVVHDRTSRTIRRTFLLIEHLRKAQSRRTADAADQATTRRRVIRMVEDTIEREIPPGPKRDQIQAEFVERLDGPDLLEDLERLPFQTVVDTLRYDLGLLQRYGGQDQKRRTPDDIAALCTLAAKRPAAPKPTAPPLPPDLPFDDPPFDDPPLTLEQAIRMLQATPPDTA